MRLSVTNPSRLLGCGCLSIAALLVACAGPSAGGSPPGAADSTASTAKFATSSATQAASPATVSSSDVKNETTGTSPRMMDPNDPIATINTSMGVIRCELFAKKAPLTVQNFIGLSMGTKAWVDPATHQTMHRPLYDGTIFHRVIPNFMIQGGDPLGTGTGDPGYQFKNETDPSLSFDAPGKLAMANSGPDTNGCQFFITVAPVTRLDGGYSLFGKVLSGQSVADAISQVPTGEADRPVQPVTIKSIRIQMHSKPAHKSHKSA